VAVAGGEEGTVDGGDELLAVDVPATRPRRDRRVDAGLVGRHPEHAEERCQPDPAARAVADAVSELPLDQVRPLGVRDAPRPRHDLVDPHGERLPCARTAHLDRPGERVPRVTLGLARRERLVPADPPARVRCREAHGVARLDREHWLELT
jgi:hypothetical protein